MSNSLGSFRSRVADYLSRRKDFAMRNLLVLKFFLHLAIFVSANHLAYLVRFEFNVPPDVMGGMRHSIPILIVAKAFAFLVFGLFRGWWRHVAIQDVPPIVAGSTLGTLLFAAGVYLVPGGTPIPRSIYLLDWGFTLAMVLGARFSIRMAREALGFAQRRDGKRVLVVGAGSAGRMIVREIRENPGLGMVEVGFVDDDWLKVNTRIYGVPVLGGHSDIPAICEKHRIDEIVIAIPSASPSRLRHILTHCKEVNARARVLPGVGELIDGTVSVALLRNVDLEDLLGRDQVALDADLLHRHITGRVVMVTGAAGSIGSELCRQLAALSPSRLVMFEIAESSLFEFENEMREKFQGLDIAAIIGDVRDRARVEEAVRAHRPAIVYHAAAYKHVPMMELHPVEAVKTNVLGTRIVAEASARLGVERFVLVSTDKAVRPTNVMGATKRLAELVIHNMNGEGKGTVFVAVRFGNVLGSVGSVIPVFRKQLETTGKVTVTHPEASRYFMLIPEAAGLILQAGAMGEGGEVFVLDMGEPVKILDLAKNLIRLSGKELGVDAEIVYTGLRPGEKLHEELIVEGEDVSGTSHPKVMKLIGNEKMPASWPRRLEELIIAAITGERRSVVEKLDALVKGYRPAYEFHGVSVAATDSQDRDVDGNRRTPAEHKPDSPPAPDSPPRPPTITPPSKSLH